MVFIAAQYKRLSGEVMFSFTEQFSATTDTAKSQLAKQLNIANEFATTAFDGVQQIIALNVSATKASVEKSSAAAKQLFEAKDPGEFFKLNAARAPNFDNILAYSQELYNIATKTQTDLLAVVKDQIRDVTAASAAVAVKPLALAAKAATPAAAAFVAPAAVRTAPQAAAAAPEAAAPAAAPAPVAAAPAKAAAAPAAAAAAREEAAPAPAVAAKVEAAPAAAPTTAAAPVPAAPVSAAVPPAPAAAPVAQPAAAAAPAAPAVKAPEAKPIAAAVAEAVQPEPKSGKGKHSPAKPNAAEAGVLKSVKAHK
jgi:phasin family protein